MARELLAWLNFHRVGNVQRAFRDVESPDNLVALSTSLLLNDRYYSKLTKLPLAELQAVPLDAGHQASLALAEKMTPATFAHCSRLYLFGLAMMYNGFPSETVDVPLISFEEVTRWWYHRTLLHDLGLSKNGRP
ncbi:hypothetical protein FB451DRAFT_1179238 [Mycena latifolia]|nr:hypothetical protein FB451DRAFT_1179238 [Mycena latifolia]